MKKYAIINPLSGEYSYYTESSDIINILSQKILDSYLRLTDNKPWTMVEDKEDGGQIWRNAQGDEIPDPIALKQRLDAEMAIFMAEVDANILASTSTSTSISTSTETTPIV